MEFRKLWSSIEIEPRIAHSVPSSSLIEAVATLAETANTAMHPCRILLLPMLGLGDAVCYLPFLHALKSRFPEADIVVFVASGAAGAILESNLPGVEIVVFNRSRHRNWVSMARLLFSVRERKFDVVISGAHLNSMRVPVFAFLSGSKLRIGAETERLSFLYNRRVQVRGDAHYFERYRMLLTGIGIKMAPQDYRPRLRPPEMAKESAERIWNQAGLSGCNKVLGFASGADINSRGRWKPSLKRWSIDGYAAVAKWASGQSGVQIVFLGSPEESAIAEEVAVRSGSPVINLCGKTNLGELQWLISKCAVFVANDTGSMHLAASTGTSLVALFGPTKAEAVLAAGDRRRIVEGQAPCAPCHFLPTCDLKRCAAMDNLAPGEVIGHISELLQLKSGQSKASTDKRPEGMLTLRYG